MATRSKTIEFAANVDVTSLNVATNRDVSIPIYIPETVVAFRSAMVMAYWRGDNTTTLTVGGVNIAIATTSAFTTQQTENLGGANVNSGESETWSVAFDATSFFTTNWSGTTQTWWVRINIGSILTINHSFKIVITYEYDDTSTTQIKTVRIPIESTRSILTTTMQTIGGATAIPAIGGSYLPETSVVVRQAFLEIMGNESPTVTTDYILQYRINGGTTTSFWDAENALISSVYIYAVIDITAQDLSVARSLEMASDVLTNRGELMGGWVTVTYEFNASTSTTIFNSLLLGAVNAPGQAGGDTVGNANTWSGNISIQEPGTITLKESAVAIGFTEPNALTLNVAVGAQATYQGYLTQQASVQCGQHHLVHRIDAGGQQGTAFATLAKGINEYSLNAYSSVVDRGWGLQGFLILNYTSGKHTGGVGAHAQSRHFQIETTTSDSGNQTSSGKRAFIPETNYWFVGICTDGMFNQDDGLNNALVFQAKRAVGEGEGSGWQLLWFTGYRTGSENHVITTRYPDHLHNWKQHPNDANASRLDVTVSRDFRRDSSLAYGWWGLWLTWHTTTYTVAGDISGSNGGTVNIELHRASDNEWLASTSRVGDGAYSFVWYDNTESVYVVAYENNTHLGRSANDVAV